MSTAEKKLAFIHEHLNAGRRVYIQTAWKVTYLTRKHAGMVKIKGESLYLQRGKNWDCIDYCQLTAQ